MVEVCERTKTKNDMLVQSIEQYKEVFVKARADFHKVINVSPGVTIGCIGLMLMIGAERTCAYRGSRRAACRGGCPCRR